MPRPSPTDLHDSQYYNLLLTLHHRDAGPFMVRYYLRSLTWVTISLNLALLTLLVLFMAESAHLPPTWQARLAWLGVIVLVFIPLVILHEALHALVYRLQGAKQIRFFIVWRFAYAYAVAPDFVTDGRELAWSAAAPFFVINSVLLVIALWLPDLRDFALGFLFAHSAGCIGDWAVLNFLWLHRRRKIYTYDDLEKSETYFFEEV